jgi:hypothetical protein
LEKELYWPLNAEEKLKTLHVNASRPYFGDLGVMVIDENKFRELTCLSEDNHIS